DYLAIAWRFHTVFIVAIPKMTNEQRNEAKRFVTLIDVLYENNVKLFCSAEAKPEKLYGQGDQSFEFSRTASRLYEMQSKDYLEKGHAV
ncbi:MAG TPA: AFG1/ZapE family ATPase, partial [Sphingomonadales bacterium]|nr:AFG1/ZapE family ATPase [Sphingomonadales bacterium]